VLDNAAGSFIAYLIRFFNKPHFKELLDKEKAKATAIAENEKPAAKKKKESADDYADRMEMKKSNLIFENVMTSFFDPKGQIGKTMTDGLPFMLIDGDSPKNWMHFVEIAELLKNTRDNSDDTSSSVEEGQQTTYNKKNDAGLFVDCDDSVSKNPQPSNAGLAHEDQSTSQPARKTKKRKEINTSKTPLTKKTKKNRKKPPPSTLTSRDVLETNETHEESLRRLNDIAKEYNSNKENRFLMKIAEDSVDGNQKRIHCMLCTNDDMGRGIDEIKQICQGTILHHVRDYSYEVGGIVIDADGKEYILPDIYSDESSNYTQQLMQADIGDLHDTSQMEQDVPSGATDASVFGAVRRSGDVQALLSAPLTASDLEKFRSETTASDFEKIRRAVTDTMADTFADFVAPATSDAVAVSTSNDVASSNKPKELSDKPIYHV
jgi:hypothetical protein